MKRKTASDSTGAEASAKKARKFDTATVEARGFSTHGPKDALPRALVEAVRAASGAASTTAAHHEIIAEKDLPGATGRSRRVLHCFGTGGDDAGQPHRLVLFYAGRRFVRKDREQTVALVEAVRRHRPALRDAQAFLLLDEAAGICRRNALYHLLEAGFVVQRV